MYLPREQEGKEEEMVLLAEHAGDERVFRITAIKNRLLEASLWRTVVHCTCGLVSLCSGRVCVKSLRSSYTGLFPQTFRALLNIVAIS